MSDPAEIVTLKWQGDTSFAEFYPNRGRLTGGGVYLIVENAGGRTAGANECWYFGQAANISNRLCDHLIGFLFFRYWLMDIDGRQRGQDLPSLYAEVGNFLADMDAYERRIVAQVTVRRKAVERVRLYWASLDSGMRNATERKLIDWLFDHKPAHVIKSNGQRGFSGHDLTVRNDFSDMSETASIRSLTEVI